MPDFMIENPVLCAVIAYLIVISIASIIVCIYDKKVSKKNRVELRIPERVLLIMSAMGGSAAMLLTMLAIRHKTKHLKFMLGIPVIIILQAAVVILLFSTFNIL